MKIEWAKKKEIIERMKENIEKSTNKNMLQFYEFNVCSKEIN